jgi:hypothetical protein
MQAQMLSRDNPRASTYGRIPFNQQDLLPLAGKLCTRCKSAETTPNDYDRVAIILL